MIVHDGAAPRPEPCLALLRTLPLYPLLTALLAKLVEPRNAAGIVAEIDALPWFTYQPPPLADGSLETNRSETDNPSSW
jgi:hypothetical protein